MTDFLIRRKDKDWNFHLNAFIVFAVNLFMQSINETTREKFINNLILDEENDGTSELNVREYILNCYNEEGLEYWNK